MAKKSIEQRRKEYVDRRSEKDPTKPVPSCAKSLTAPIFANYQLTLLLPVSARFTQSMPFFWMVTLAVLAKT